LLSRLQQVAPGHDAVVVAGSLPRGVSAALVRQLLEQLKARPEVALDSSGEALRAGLQAAPWLVKQYRSWAKCWAGCG
jgi:1-phosphofructokinase